MYFETFIWVSLQTTQLYCPSTCTSKLSLGCPCKQHSSTVPLHVLRNFHLGVPANYTALLSLYMYFETFTWVSLQTIQLYCPSTCTSKLSLGCPCKLHSSTDPLHVLRNFHLGVPANNTALLSLYMYFETFTWVSLQTTQLYCPSTCTSKLSLGCPCKLHSSTVPLHVLRNFHLGVPANNTALLSLYVYFETFTWVSLQTTQLYCPSTCTSKLSLGCPCKLHSSTVPLHVLRNFHLGVPANYTALLSLYMYFETFTWVSLQTTQLYCPSTCTSKLLLGCPCKLHSSTDPLHVLRNFHLGVPANNTALLSLYVYFETFTWVSLYIKQFFEYRETSLPPQNISNKYYRF